MPAFNQPQQRRRYAQINNGKFCEWVTDHNEEYSHMMGYIVNITFKHDEKYGLKLCIHMVDEQDYWIIETFANSGYAFYFSMMMQNINYQQPVVMNAILNEKEGKKESKLFIKQNGENIKWYYNKDHMKDLPPLVPCKVKNPNGPGLIDGWDNTERMQFLHNLVINTISPALQRMPNPYPNHPVYSGNVPANGNSIAGHYFGKEEKFRVPGPVSQDEKNYAATQAGAPANFTPADDLPF